METPDQTPRRHVHSHELGVTTRSSGRPSSKSHVCLSSCGRGLSSPWKAETHRSPRNTDTLRRSPRQGRCRRGTATRCCGVPHHMHPHHAREPHRDVRGFATQQLPRHRLEHQVRRRQRLTTSAPSPTMQRKTPRRSRGSLLGRRCAPVRDMAQVHRQFGSRPDRPQETRRLNSDGEIRLALGPITLSCLRLLQPKTPRCLVWCPPG